MNLELLIPIIALIIILIAAIRTILIGLGIAKDPIRHMKQKSLKMLIQGIAVFVIFLVTCIILYRQNVKN